MTRFFIIIAVLFYYTSAFADGSSDYKKVKCVIHLHTDISSGEKPMEYFVEKAREEAIGAIIFTDNDWQRWEYGLPPFRRLIKKVVQRKSVMTYGVERYLDLINKLDEKYKDIVIIAGVQTNPFYYWSGNFFKGTMTLNNRNKDMLVIGLNDADAYRDMPLLANYKSRFDAYHGDEFTRPHQDLINYVIDKGGLIFWSHPEGEENTVINGIRLITVPYHWDLVGTQDYTGFVVFWKGYEKAGNPKGLWDRILTEYCKEKRRSPVWAIGELEEEVEHSLDFILNIVYVKELSREDILDAFKKGRFYVTFNLFDRPPLVLEEFSVSDESSVKTAIMGEEVSFPDDPIIKIRVSHDRDTDININVKLIRNNEIIKEFSGKSQVDVEYKDEGLTKKRYYYRIDVMDSLATQLIPNPIFLEKSDK